ncbi:MAG: hypothetical protein ACQ5SW_10460, partial [Sphaerochaetaceae bacterium]
KMKTKILNALDHLSRLGRQANRLSPNAYLELTDIGIKRIYDWAAPTMRPVHIDEFHKYLGETVCKTLLYCNCKNCPAKKYDRKTYVCRRKLGEWSMKHQKER